MLEQLLPPDDHHHLLFLLRLIEKIQWKLWMIAGVPHLIEIRQTVLNTCMGWIFGKWVFYVTISFLYIIYVYCIYVRTQVQNVPLCPSHCGADIQPRLGRYKMQQIPLVLSELNVFIISTAPGRYPIPTIPSTYSFECSISFNYDQKGIQRQT